MNATRMGAGRVEDGHLSCKIVSRVFVVDDEPVISSTIGEILRLNGFKAQSFVSPLKALDAAQRNAPDLLISDVMMPELSGIELAIRLKLLCPGCKVLLFSGQAQTYDLLLHAREQGHDFDLLSKPVHPNVLIDRVNAMTRPQT